MTFGDIELFFLVDGCVCNMNICNASSIKIENICWRKGTLIKSMSKISFVPGSIVKLDVQLSNA